MKLTSILIHPAGVFFQKLHCVLLKSIFLDWRLGLGVRLESEKKMILRLGLNFTAAGLISLEKLNNLGTIKMQQAALA